MPWTKLRSAYGAPPRSPPAQGAGYQKKINIYIVRLQPLVVNCAKAKFVEQSAVLNSNLKFVIETGFDINPGPLLIYQIFVKW